MTVTVVGLGKIGLPLAVQFAKMGKVVFGADINPDTVDFVNRGIEPFPEEENLQEFLSEVVSSGSLTASTNTTECVAQSNVVVVVVPLFVDNNAEPDFRSMDAATVEIAKGLNKGTLVAYETTLPVGTTRNRFTKKLEEISGLKVGQDFHVVFSPERVLTGRVFSDLRKYPKILGGVTQLCASRGQDFYSGVIEFDSRPDLPRPNGVWVLNSAEAAEFVKLAETTYRDVNIGLANQFAKFADSNSLNVYDVIEAANSQPYSNIHQPGIAVGGHCIPVYPQFYLWGDPSASIVSEARKTNSGMPKYAMDLAAHKLASFEGKEILILGLAYRAGVKEDAFSGALDLLNLSDQMGCITYVHDWMYSPSELISRGMRPLAPENYESISLLIIQNADIKNIQTLAFSFPNCELILDGRNLLAKNENAATAISKLTNAEVLTLGSFS